MIQKEDTRRALYTYMMNSDQNFDLPEQDLRALQAAIHSDIRTPSVPLDIKLRASLIKNNIASHPDFGFLPSILEHAYFLESSIQEMQS